MESVINSMKPIVFSLIISLIDSSSGVTSDALILGPFGFERISSLDSTVDRNLKVATNWQFIYFSQSLASNVTLSQRKCVCAGIRGEKVWLQMRHNSKLSWFQWYPGLSSFIISFFCFNTFIDSLSVLSFVSGIAKLFIEQQFTRLLGEIEWIWMQTKP